MSTQIPAPSKAYVNKITSQDPTQAKWIEFQTISWTDETGKQRTWEAASRKTRKEAGIDAVSITTLLKHPSRPLATIIILQYRPPANATCVEFPAGLVDGGETAEEAALRELKEETGYGGEDGEEEVQIVDVGPVVVCDPGMSTANMRVVTVEVRLPEGDDGLTLPVQHLDEGEHIQRVVVPVAELYERLKGFSEKGFMVDARLWHWAAGFSFAKLGS